MLVLALFDQNNKDVVRTQSTHISILYVTELTYCILCIQTAANSLLLIFSNYFFFIPQFVYSTHFSTRVPQSSLKICRFDTWGLTFKSVFRKWEFDSLKTWRETWKTKKQPGEVSDLNQKKFFHSARRALHSHTAWIFNCSAYRLHILHLSHVKTTINLTQL